MITVNKPGMLTTVQDSGRLGYQAYGMPVAGAMDIYAYRVANMLVCNDSNAAVFEMTMVGGIFGFEEDVWVAICGADMQATLNGEKVANWSRIFIKGGSELAFGYGESGCRSYLAVHGGIGVPELLGSRSTYTRGKFGGFEGRSLRTGDQLQIGQGETTMPQCNITLATEFIPEYTGEVTLRVMLGPQHDLFTTQGIETLFNNPYQISNDADRMGYRLEGDQIQHRQKPDIISDALCQGAIQVPGHGMPIIMMADRQTTGGYAKIGTVISADLSKLAQAKPGEMVNFVECSDEEAVGALQELANNYEKIKIHITNQQEQVMKKMRHFKINVDGQQYDVKVMEG